MIRTFLLFALSMTFFRASSVGDAIGLLGCGFRNVVSGAVVGALISGFSEQGIRIMNDVSVLGLTYADIIIVIVSLIILLAVDMYKNKTKGDVRDAVAARPVVLRFIIWFALLFYVVLYPVSRFATLLAKGLLRLMGVTTRKKVPTSVQPSSSAASMIAYGILALK